MKRKSAMASVFLLALGAVAQITPMEGQQPQFQPPRLNYGRPLAPNQDMYYLDEPKESWIPDEFLSNPDSTVDPKTLKGYHLPPFLHKVTVLNPVVKPGETVRFEAMVEDAPGLRIDPWPMGFHGPAGRRTQFNVQMRARADNPFVHEGSLRVHEWAEPGLYFLYTLGIIANELGHSKAYFQDYHPGLKDVYFTVLPHDHVDVTPPELQGLRIGEQAGAAGELPTFDISQAIPIYARATDNLSGVNTIKIRFINSEGKYSETSLLPLMGKKDWYVGYISLPDHYVGGEYRVMSMWMKDRAGQDVYMFGNTNPMLKAARFNIKQDPGKVDKISPRLVTVIVDKDKAALGSEIQVTAVAVDDKSGMGALVIDFAAMPSYIDKRRVHMKPTAQPAVIQKSGFNVDAHTYTGSFRTHVMDEPGEWHVVRVMARDNADNLLDMREYEYPELASVKINFSGGVRPGAGTGTTIQTASPTSSPSSPPAATAPGKIRRVDMTPPHPPRGACLNCHEP